MVERTRKESHQDTIWYEIDMLEYCYGVLENKPPATTTGDWNLLIEGFLLHYRNLIQFFSGNAERHRRHGNDLSTLAPEVWAYRPLTAEESTTMRDLGTALDDEYSDRISVCLQHCTRERAESLIDWNIREMYQRISPLTAAFKVSFPREPRVTRTAARALNATTSSHPITVSTTYPK